MPNLFAAVLDNSGALTQGYGLAGPMPTSRLVSGHSNHQVLGPSNVIHDRMTVVVPAVYMKSEISSVHPHLQTETLHGGRVKRGFTLRSISQTS